MEHRTETHRVIWPGLFLPRRAKSLLGDTAMKDTGEIFRAADCVCLGLGLGVLGGKFWVSLAVLRVWPWG